MVSAKKERQGDDQRTDQPTAQRVMVSGFEPRTFFPLHVKQQPRPEVRNIRRAPEFRRVSKLELTSPEPNSRPSPRGRGQGRGRALVSLFFHALLLSRLRVRSSESGC